MKAITALSTDQLIDLRAAVRKEILARADRMKADLQLITGNGVVESGPKARGGKLAPKYRDPKSGLTWAGRGNRPRWMKGRPEKYRINA